MNNIEKYLIENGWKKSPFHSDDKPAYTHENLLLLTLYKDEEFIELHVCECLVYHTDMGFDVSDEKHEKVLALYNVDLELAHNTAKAIKEMENAWEEIAGKESDND